MIKTENGCTQASGKGIDLLADLACIIESLATRMPKSLIEQAIEAGFKAAEESDDMDELTKLMNKLEKIVKEQGETK